MSDRIIIDGSFAKAINTDSNELLDCPEIVIQLPDPDTVYRGDKADILQRLNNLESPSERLLTLAKSVFIPYEDPTHEAYLIRTITLAGASIGFIHGGILNSQHIHEDYIRKHNATIFENKAVADRHFWDNLFWRIGSQGLPNAIKAGLLCGAASTTALGSIVYRNELYLPDWLVGFSAIGSLSRCWLGMRGVVGGGMFGVAAGLIGYGLAKCYELVIGKSVSHMRYIEHSLWLERRAAKQEQIHRLGRYDFSERMKKLS